MEQNIKMNKQPLESLLPRLGTQCFLRTLWGSSAPCLAGTGRPVSREVWAGG